jgi:hypothetical protein
MKGDKLHLAEAWKILFGRMRGEAMPATANAKAWRCPELRGICAL